MPVGLIKCLIVGLTAVFAGEGPKKGLGLRVVRLGEGEYTCLTKVVIAENKDGAKNVIASRMAQKIVGDELNALMCVWYAFVLCVSAY